MGDVIRDDIDGLDDRFQSMYRSALPTVFGFLSFRTGGDRELAEDLTAETFAAAVARYKVGEEHLVTTSWLLTVARRRLIDHWRRSEVAERKLVLVAGAAQSEEPNNEERSLVMAVLAELPDSQRAALVLQHLEGMTVVEVAEIIGRSETATESLLARARRTFRRRYEEVTDG